MAAVSRSVMLAAALLAGATVKTGAQQNVTELYAQDSLTLRVGQKEGLSVQAFDDKGNAVLLVRYRSSDEHTARVQSNGTVLGLKPGLAQITVQAGRKSRTVVVVVLENSTPGDSTHATDPPQHPTDPRPPAPPAVPIATLAIDPSAIYLLPAENLRLAVRALRADGTPVLQPRVTWKSLRTEVAGVGDTTGIVTGIGAGQGVIQGTAPGGASVTIPVVVALTELDFTISRLVLDVRDSEALHVVVPSQNRRELRTSDLQWRSTDLAVARVSQTGEVEAVAPGKAEIIASGFLQERRLPVVVHPEIAAFLTRPSPGDTVRIPVNGARIFSARAVAADSTPITDIAFDWQVGDTAIASLDTASGQLHARKIGTTTLTFSLKGFRSKAWTVRVTPGLLRLDQEQIGLHVGEKRKLVATAVDENGQPMGPASDLIWTSSNGTIASVSDGGEVEAVGLGRATVSATVAGGKSATTQVLVNGDLLFSSTRGGAKYGLFSAQRTAGSAIRPLLVDNGANVLQAVLSPDGTRLAFSSDRGGGGRYAVYVSAADGQGPRRLFADSGNQRAPHWAADGRQILFSVLRGNSSQVYRINADGSGLKALTSLSGLNDEPVAAPDGQHIAFAATRDGVSSVAVMNIDGSNPVLMTDPRDRRALSPAYLPNGDLVYLAERKDGSHRYKIVYQRSNGGVERPALYETDTPILGFSISRDGLWLAIALRNPEPERGSAESSLVIRAVAGGADITVPLQPGERVLSPSF